MSQKNVELARQALEAFNRGDRDAWFHLHDPELEFHADPEWPEARVPPWSRASLGLPYEHERCLGAE